MRIVIGAPIAQRAWIVQDWIDHIRAQDIDAELEVLAYCTPSTDGTEEILRRNGVEVILHDAPSRNNDRIREHIWDIHEYGRMALWRNSLLAKVREHEPHYFFSLDSDILIPPNCISRLLATMMQTGANAVSPLLSLEKQPTRPFAWNFMEWTKGDADRSNFQLPAERLPKEPFPMDILLAAIFMDPRAMECEWKVDKQGEDIGWARNADSLGLKRYVEPRLLCAHMMMNVTP